ncbi:MAG: NUDIX domain-containing protein [Candidatus Lokiarchaeota archaeon]|nr:NUDIX domain-containing protein [Candidatus Lokiarchaeota archaeon]
MDPLSPKELEKLKYDLRKYPIRPHIGVGGLFIHKGHILLIQRKYDPGAHKWSIPGGHLKLGEMCKEGAEREFMEETALKANAKDLAGIIDTVIYDDQHKIKYHYVLINYFMEVIDERFSDDKRMPKLEAHSDAEDIQFVLLENISKLEITGSLRTLLQDLSIL